MTLRQKLSARFWARLVTIAEYVYCYAEEKRAAHYSTQNYSVKIPDAKCHICSTEQLTGGIFDVVANHYTCSECRKMDDPGSDVDKHGLQDER